MSEAAEATISAMQSFAGGSRDSGVAMIIIVIIIVTVGVQGSCAISAAVSSSNCTISRPASTGTRARKQNLKPLL